MQAQLGAFGGKGLAVDDDVELVQACLEHCTQYALDRQAFGRPIGANQGVAFQVADLAVMAETARLLTYQAAWLHDAGRPYKQAAAMGEIINSLKPAAQ